MWPFSASARTATRPTVQLPTARWSSSAIDVIASPVSPRRYRFENHETWSATVGFSSKSVIPIGSPLSRSSYSA